jgi:hypothetical protein
LAEPLHHVSELGQWQRELTIAAHSGPNLPNQMIEKRKKMEV